MPPQTGCGLRESSHKAPGEGGLCHRDTETQKSVQGVAKEKGSEAEPKMLQLQGTEQGRDGADLVSPILLSVS